jgi:hypothetical protein
VFQPGGGSQVPPPTLPRSDFSRVWGTNPVFVPARWSTPVSAHSSAVGLPEGTVFNYILNRDAKVTVAIRAEGSTRPLVTLVRKGHQGRNKLPFSGRIKGKAMKPGRYRAIFRAGAGKKRSKPTALAFRIARN